MKCTTRHKNEPSSFEDAIVQEAVVIPPATSHYSIRNIIQKHSRCKHCWECYQHHRSRRETISSIKTINELRCVGAGIGGGSNIATSELHGMKCDEAMVSKDMQILLNGWKLLRKNMTIATVENKVWTPVPKGDVPPGAFGSFYCWLSMSYGAPASWPLSLLQLDWQQSLAVDVMGCFLCTWLDQRKSWWS